MLEMERHVVKNTSLASHVNPDKQFPTVSSPSRPIFGSCSVMTMAAIPQVDIQLLMRLQTSKFSISLICPRREGKLDNTLSGCVLLTLQPILSTMNFPRNPLKI
jgi:hypothetical protein